MNKVEIQESDSKSFIFLNKKAFTVAICIAALTLMIFLPTLRNDFVNWDDDVYVYQNSNIQRLNAAFLPWAFQFHASNWHPLTWLSHAIDYAIWGPRAWGII